MGTTEHIRALSLDPVSGRRYFYAGKSTRPRLLTPVAQAATLLVNTQFTVHFGPQRTQDP